MSALQSIEDSEILRIDVALRRSLSGNPELCLGPTGLVLASTSFVDNELHCSLPGGGSALVWEELYPGMLEDFATYFCVWC